jgi:uncharacterized membrane protein
MDWIATISRGIHVLAAVCWIGGLYFLIRVVRPILLQGENPEKNYTLLREIQKKFRGLAGMMLLTVLVTGIGNLVLGGYSSHGLYWKMVLHTKLLLVVILFIIYFMNVSGAKKMQKLMQENPGAAPKPPGFILPKTALILGLIIIFLGIILHTGIVG